MLLRIFALLILCLAASTPASAIDRQISVRISESALQATCAKVGGTFFPSTAGNGYDCAKVNCDQKGGTCVVNCSNEGVCTGSTPSLQTQPHQTLIGILQDGDRVLHEPDQTPPTSLSSAGEGGPAAAGAPSKSPGPGPIF